MNILVRALLLFFGVVSCAIGASAGSKLTRETLDSPRWMIAAIALVLLAVGVTAIATAVRAGHDT